MIHYHGLPITPNSACLAAISGGHAFVSFAHADQLPLAVEVCQSFALDNGAFSAWRAGEPVTDWSHYYGWIGEARKFPHADFAVIPDVIDGTAEDNDALLKEWPYGHFGAPVYHMHLPLSRLQRLCEEWPRVCLGSSGFYATVGDAKWWNRMAEIMRVLCDSDGYPHNGVRLHGLRMLNTEVFRRLPLASADSTNIGRNIGIDSHWKGTYTPPNKDIRAAVMRSRIESVNGAQRWAGGQIQETLCGLF